MTYFPSHSFEQFYQSVRRCWRFGQKQPVTVDVIHTQGQSRILENLTRKKVAAEGMFANLVAEMNNAIGIDRSIHHSTNIEVPSWLS